MIDPTEDRRDTIEMDGDLEQFFARLADGTAHESYERDLARQRERYTTYEPYPTGEMSLGEEPLIELEDDHAS
jgi:hypothetical protein